MAHPREQLVEAIVALLIAAGTSAGSRVSQTQIDPLRNPDKITSLPALSVYALNDPIDEGGSSEMEVAHEIELEIAAWVVHTDALPADKAMNVLAEQVEVAMRSSEYLGGLASEVVHKGTVMEVAELGRTSRQIGIAVLTYSVKYHIALAAT